MAFNGLGPKLGARMFLYRPGEKSRFVQTCGRNSPALAAAKAAFFTTCDLSADYGRPSRLAALQRPDEASFGLKINALGQQLAAGKFHGGERKSSRPTPSTQ